MKKIQINDHRDGSGSIYLKINEEKKDYYFSISAGYLAKNKINNGNFKESFLKHIKTLNLKQYNILCNDCSEKENQIIKLKKLYGGI
ncbi:MAG: hypothetical protein KAI16_00780 [Candidatus Pacebacteria bacterium]|nr:hypothetical protein [Candidatus Paceibacterota bacterium]